MPIQEVRFARGTSDSMPQDKLPGRLLVQTNSGDMFLDDTEEQRIQLGDSRKLSLAGGTMTGPLDMGNQSLTGLAAPTGVADAARKQYVDDAIAGLRSEITSELDGFLPLSGGIMVGDINMNTHGIHNLVDPSAEGDAANKKYVDGRISGLSSVYLPLSGGTLSGNLSLGSHRVTGLAEPTVGTDAATKTYVDGAISGAPYLNTSGVTPMAGNLSMANHGITNLLDPSSPQDATTKNYVDTAISDAVGSITGFNVDSNGGAGYDSYEALVSAHPEGVSGTFYLVKNPDSSAPNTFDEYFWTGTSYEKAGAFGDVDLSGLATTSYVDSQIGLLDSRFLPISGGTMQGDITIPYGHKLHLGSGPSITAAFETRGISIDCTGDTDAGLFSIQVGTEAGSKTYTFSAEAGLDMDMRNVTNLAEPTAGFDAATKNYVDTQIQQSVSDTKVTQNNSDANLQLRVLLSSTADDTTVTDAINKSGKMFFNPSTGVLTVTRIEAIIDDGVVTA